MRKKISFFIQFLFILLFLHGVGISADFRAKIQGQWGSDLKPIYIFGKSVNVGETVEANFLRDDGGYYWDDPIPSYSICPGWGAMREPDKSVISRVTCDGTSMIVLIRHAGGKGYYPGSKGWFAVLNPDLQIVEVLAHGNGLHTDFAGFGWKLTKNGKLFQWYVRGGCPACGCHENQAGFILVIKKIK